MAEDKPCSTDVEYKSNELDGVVNFNNDASLQIDQEDKPQIHVHNVHKLTDKKTLSLPEDDFQQARAACVKAIHEAKNNPKAHLNQNVMNAFKAIYENDPIEYEALRTDIRLANRLIRIGVLDKFVKQACEDVRSTQGTDLADLAIEHCELWHDADRVAYATFERGNDEEKHLEHWPIESSSFREYLAWLGHTELGASPSSETIRTVGNILTGCAKFDGKEYKPFKRVAVDEQGYWIDVCNDKWDSILVTAAGWQIVRNSPIKFIRSKTMRALPVPIKRGTINEFWKLVNIPDEDRNLVLAWMLESLRANTPKVVIELVGEQGSAKSTTQRIIRQFIDPSRVPLRGMPKSREDIYIAAANSHVISYENLSGLSYDYSDVFCIISTGGGTATRAHYTNQEESVIEARNPIMLNGIGAVITRPDLLDRAIVITLPVIKQRLTEGQLATMLEQSAAGIMGALLDLFAGALAELPNVKIPDDQLPRMADFAQLGEAFFLHLGHQAGEFLNLYRTHRQDAIRRTIDSHPVAIACIQFVENGHSHSGTVNSLLDKLNEFKNGSMLERGDCWPKSPKGLGNALRRVAAALRLIGIDCSIEQKAQRDGIHCILKKTVIDPIEETM